MEDLSTIREKINEIDNKIVELWKERMQTCLKVAKYKKENNLPVLDAARERELLNRIMWKSLPVPSSPSAKA